MKHNIRSLTATALLVLGFSKASAKLEGAAMAPATHPEAPTSYCLPCGCIE